VSALEAIIGPKLYESATQLLDVRLEQKWTLYAEQFKTLADFWKANPLKSRDEYNKLAEGRAQVKVDLKQIEEDRVACVKPLNDQVRVFNDTAKMISAPAIAFDKAAEQVMLAFDRAERETLRLAEEKRFREAAEEAERLRLAEEAAAAATTDKDRQIAEAQAEAANQNLQAIEVAAPLPVPTRTMTDTGTTYSTKRMVAKIVNPDLVPREWCVPDEPRVKKAALSGVVIPGVSVEEEESLPVRGRR